MGEWYTDYESAYVSPFPHLGVFLDQVYPVVSRSPQWIKHPSFPPTRKLVLTISTICSHVPHHPIEDIVNIVKAFAESKHVLGTHHVVFWFCLTRVVHAASANSDDVSQKAGLLRNSWGRGVGVVCCYKFHDPTTRGRKMEHMTV